jgi:hypothetical protein
MFRPLRKRGLFSMKLNEQSQLETDESNVEVTEAPNQYDPELADKIIQAVPRHTWPAVLDAAVVNIVDELPTDTLFRIAELYLTDYYLENPKQIIPDMLRIKGAEATVYILDALQLDKLPEPARRRAEEEAQQHTDNSPSSIDPN